MPNVQCLQCEPSFRLVGSSMYQVLLHSSTAFSASQQISKQVSWHCVCCLYLTIAYAFAILKFFCKQTSNGTYFTSMKMHNSWSLKFVHWQYQLLEMYWATQRTRQGKVKILWGLRKHLARTNLAKWVPWHQFSLSLVQPIHFILLIDYTTNDSQPNLWGHNIWGPLSYCNMSPLNSFSFLH